MQSDPTETTLALNTLTSEEGEWLPLLPYPEQSPEERDNISQAEARDWILRHINSQLDAIGYDNEVLEGFKLLSCMPERPARFQGGVRCP